MLQLHPLMATRGQNFGATHPFARCSGPIRDGEVHV